MALRAHELLNQFRNERLAATAVSRGRLNFEGPTAGVPVTSSQPNINVTYQGEISGIVYTQATHAETDEVNSDMTLVKSLRRRVKDLKAELGERFGRLVDNIPGSRVGARRTPSFA